MATNGLEFVRWPSGLDSLYILAETSPQTARMGYLLSEPVDGLDQMSLADSWSKYRGRYVFFEPFGNQQFAVSEFVSAAQKYLGVPGLQNTRFAWFRNAAQPFNGQLSGTLVQVFPQPSAENAAPVLTRGSTSFNFRNFALVLSAGCPVSLDVDQGRFVFTNGPLNGRENILRIRFALNFWPNATRQVGVPEPPPDCLNNVIGAQAYLPLASEGLFQFDTNVDNEVLEVFGAGLHYYSNAPTTKVPLFVVGRDEPQYQALIDELTQGGSMSVLISVFLDHFIPLPNPQVAANGQQHDSWKIESDGSEYLAVNQSDGLHFFALLRNSEGEVASRRYPVFDIGSVPQAAAGTSPTVTLATSFDPLDHEDPERTCFAFAPNVAVGSYLRTNHGHSVELTPIDSPSPQRAAKFVLCNNPTVIVPDTQEPDRRAYYLVPSGDFALSSPKSKVEPGQGVMLLCGLSGIETINFTQPTGLSAVAPNDVLTFHTNLPAYAPNFRGSNFPDINGSPAKDEARLTGAATTSWTSIQGSARSSQAAPDGQSPPATWYWTQPDNAPLFSPVATKQDEYLDFKLVPAVKLDGESGVSALGAGLNGDDRLCYPLVPYAGVLPDDLVQLRDFEQKVLQVNRRRQIYDAAAKLPPAAARAESAEAVEQPADLATTPQGLLASFRTSDHAWETVTLSYNPHPNEGSGSDEPAPDFEYLRLASVGNPPGQKPTSMQLALQSNRLFWVITREEALTNPQVNHFAQSKTKIAGWKFDLSTEYWSEHGTILIFKFCDKPLEELVENASNWSLADEYVTDVQQTQQALRQIIADAKQDLATNPDLSYFVHTVVADAKWNGILALNVYFPIAGSNALPEQLSGLAAGIDAKGFYAHHFGINVNPVTNEDGQLTLHGSSLFGLINYSHGPLENVSSDYAFVVRSLKVLFHSTAVQSFGSTIDLTINNLFSQSVELQSSNNGNNVVTLTGTYESDGDTGTYVFLTTQTSVFDFASNVLETISLLRVEFYTLVDGSQSESDANAKVETRFAIWGVLSFVKQDDFDVFSFGPTQSNPGGGLSFDNLSIDMDFPAGNPSQTTFAFSPGGIKFDDSTSTSRNGSLYSHFPLELTGFVSSQGGKSPQQLGYATVDNPLTLGSLSSAWYGLVFDLKLGTLGDLAGKVGLVAQLLAAWSPGTSARPTFMLGLKLPFGRGNTIGIEGVLALAVKRFQMVVDQPATPGDASAGEESDAPEGTSYILKFLNITITILKQTLPPTGNTSIYLFGDPGSSAKNTTLGWYGAYAKEPPKKKPKQSVIPDSSNGDGDE